LPRKQIGVGLGPDEVYQEMKPITLKKKFARKSPKEKRGGRKSGKVEGPGNDSELCRKLETKPDLICPGGSIVVNDLGQD